MKLFKQIIKVTVDKKVFDFTELDIAFNVKCTSDNKSDVATIQIYNLNNLTKSNLKKGQTVSILAGYEELNGVIFNGVVESVTHKLKDNDIVTTLIATPNNFLYTNTIVNKQFKQGITAREILANLEKSTNFNIDVKDLVKNVNYPNGKVFSNRLSNVMQILAKDTGSAVRVYNNTIEFTNPKKQYSTVINLKAENGLINVEKVEDKKEGKDKKPTKTNYQIECLLIPLVKIGQVLNIESMMFTGKVVVKECIYSANGIDEFKVIAKGEIVE